MLQWRSCMPQWKSKVLSAAPKTQNNQINNKNFKKSITKILKPFNFFLLFLQGQGTFSVPWRFPTPPTDASWTYLPNKLESRGLQRKNSSRASFMCVWPLKDLVSNWFNSTVAILKLLIIHKQGAPSFYFTLGPANYIVSLERSLRQWSSILFRIGVLNNCVIPGLWNYDSSFYYKGVIENLREQLSFTLLSGVTFCAVRLSLVIT